MVNQMVVYGAIVMTYLTVAIAALFLLLRRKPISKEPIAKIVAAAKDFAVTTMKLAAWNAAEASRAHAKTAS